MAGTSPAMTKNDGRPCEQGPIRRDVSVQAKCLWPFLRFTRNAVGYGSLLSQGVFVVTALNSTNALQQIKATIVLAGAGKMGGAMLSGWLARGLDAKRVVVIEPHPSNEVSALTTKGIRLNPTPNEIGAVATLVVALKPQTFREAGSVLKSFAGSSTLVVSIMAGISLAPIQEDCGGRGVLARAHAPGPGPRG